MSLQKQQQRAESSIKLLTSGGVDYSVEGIEMNGILQSILFGCAIFMAPSVCR